MALRKRAATWSTLMVIGTIVAMGASIARASLVAYTDEAAFRAAAPSLAIQTFAAANVTPGSFVLIGNPLDSATNDGVFAPGDILPGLSIAASVGASGTHPTSDLLVTSVGYFAMPENAVFANFFIETLGLEFSPGITAVGLDLLSLLEGSRMTVTGYAPSGDPLGSFFVSVPRVGGTPQFFGIVATGDEIIRRIDIEASGPNAEGVGRVLFASTVPEPTTLLLVATAVLFIAVSPAARRRSI